MITLYMDHEFLCVKKDGEEILSFGRDDNICDLYYEIVGLLKALDIEHTIDHVEVSDREK